MIKQLLYIVVSLLFALGSTATDLVFEGQRPANEEAIIRFFANNPNNLDSLRTMLVNEGYLDAAVRQEAQSVYIYAGERFVIESITWLPDSSTQSVNRAAFTQVNTESLIERKLRQYRENGYFYTSATILDVSGEQDGVSLTIRLNPGPLLKLGKSIYSGLKRTRPELVEKYIAFGEGRPLTEENLAYAERRAAAIPFVHFRPPLKIRPLPGYTGADLEFVFEEKKQALFSGGGGIVPGTSSSFVWNLDLKFQNIFGGGRVISLRSEKRETNRQTLQVGYRQPVMLLGLGEIGLNVATRDYRDQFYEFTAGGDYRARISPAFGVGLELGWRSVEPSNQVPSYTTIHTAFSIERTVLDNLVNPSSGLTLSWTISFSYRRYASESLNAGLQRNSFNETRSTVRVNWYQRLRGVLVGHLRLNYVGLETGEALPPISELYYVGGPGSLRGYRNEQFTAVRTVFGTAEPRLRFESGYLFVFADAAYLNNRISDANDRVRTDEFYRYSYGIGAAIMDQARTVKISIGWNPDSAFDQPRLSLEFTADI
ncbi:MAG: BamA/TamA family outer membrane protein [Candidatus Zixiibacteriota bacterium]|nr:MAG: BamA/TamA family outer membrane protein [candidate division Zixibacteria bacterium]